MRMSSVVVAVVGLARCSPACGGAAGVPTAAAPAPGLEAQDSASASSCQLMIVAIAAPAGAGSRCSFEARHTPKPCGKRVVQLRSVYCIIY